MCARKRKDYNHNRSMYKNITKPENVTDLRAMYSGDVLSEQDFNELVEKCLEDEVELSKIKVSNLPTTQQSRNIVVYTDESKDRINKQAYISCSLMGATNKDLGSLFAVNASTISGWLKTKPEFSESVLVGRDHYNKNVIEKSLVSSATGITYDEVTKNVDEDGNETVVKKTSKFIPPNFNAIKFYLTNRGKERWKDTKEVDIQNRFNLDFSKVSTEDLDDLSELLREITSEPRDGGDVSDIIECGKV